LPNAAAIQIPPQNIGVAFSMTPGLVNDTSIEDFGIGVSVAPNASCQGQLRCGLFPVTSFSTPSELI
jgi:hypothetical protein